MVGTIHITSSPKERTRLFCSPTYSVIPLVRHLLTKEPVSSVPTETFSGSIEPLFTAPRRSVECNDQFNVRSALPGFEKVFNTVIVMSLQGSNNKDIPTYLQALPPVKQQASNRSATFLLGQLKTSQPRQHLPILQLSAKVYVGGYIAHVVGMGA